MALRGRSLGPGGTHGYWKEGDIQNTGGTKGVDYIFKGGTWQKAKKKKKKKKDDLKIA